MGVGAKAVRRVGLSHGQKVKDEKLGNPDWAVHIQLSKVFNVHPQVWEDYEPSEIELIAEYLEGYEDGQEIWREQNKKK